MCAVMAQTDPDPRFEAIQLLLLEAGRLMEDSSPDLAMGPSDSAGALDLRIASLEAAASDIQALAATARTLFRLSCQPD